MDIESVFEQLSSENDELQAANDQLITQNEEMLRQLEQLTHEKTQALDWYYDLCKENKRLVTDIENLRFFQSKKWLRCPHKHPYQKPCPESTSCTNRSCKKWHVESPCSAGHKCRSLTTFEKNYYYEQVLNDNLGHVCPNFHPCQIADHNFECQHGSKCRDVDKKACIGYHSPSMCPRGDSCVHLHSFWKKVDC